MSKVAGDVVALGINPNVASRADPGSQLTPHVTGSRRNAYTQNVLATLGHTATLSSTGSVNLDLRRGPVHSTTGIPYAIGGTATVVSQKVGLHLTSFEDPIKALLGTGVHSDEKVIIRRKYCVGGGSTIVPERAPARTVAIQEDVREVMLTRYGADIEMNLNLFLTNEAGEEMDMKVEFQKKELERQLIDIGYTTLIREGTDIVDGIMRSNPAYNPNNITDSAMYRRRAQNIYAKQIFGAFNKHRFPLANLLAAAKYASAYSIATQKGSVMIIPRGVPELTTYARREKMEYRVSGLQNQKPITMEMEGGFTDPNSGVQIFVHYPTPTYEHGAANPTVAGQQSGLTDHVYVITKHKPGKIPDIVNGGYRASTSGTVRICKVVASSAILGAPGSSTGELLIGYPFTGISTSQTEERLRVQLRCYLGACLYQPDAVIVLPNVFVEGITEVGYIGDDTYEKLKEEMGDSKYAPLLSEAKQKEVSDKESELLAKQAEIEANTDNSKTAGLEAALTALQEEIQGIIEGAISSDEFDNIPYGATYNTDGSVLQENTGEFGQLDHPRHYIGLHGIPQAYEGGGLSKNI